MADPTQTSTWSRAEQCPCKGCSVARQQVIDLVLSLHKQIVGPYDNYICDHCTDLYGDTADVIPYPCPTLKLLGIE